MTHCTESTAPAAGYGKALLKELSEHLSGAYGDGFSVSALQYMRGFFLSYPELLAKQHAVRVEFDALPKQHALRGESGSDGAWRPGLLNSDLSWTHYRTLLKVERRDVRDFYEIEAIRSGWSARQLERQINFFLFERLAKSRDKKACWLWPARARFWCVRKTRSRTRMCWNFWTCPSLTAWWSRA